MGFSECKKNSTKDQVRSASSAKTFRKALQRDEKSFTTANLCQNHQIRDTFSPRQRRDLRKTRSPPAPNACLERRREIGAIQAKMAHPQNNRNTRLKEDYLIVRLKSPHGWAKQHRRQKHCKPTASLRFHRKMTHLHRQKPQIPCIAMVMNLPTISGQPNDAAAQPMNQVPNRKFQTYRAMNMTTLRQKLLDALNVMLRFIRKLNEPEHATAMPFATPVGSASWARANTPNSTNVCMIDTP